MKSISNSRVHLLDEIRGFAILCMVLYHSVYDLLFVFEWSFPFFHSQFLNLVRDLFAGLFILISGAACRFSHSNLKRGLLCFLFGMVMTAGSLLFVPALPIWFGILHLLGCSMIIFALFHSFLDKFNYIILFVIFSVLFLLTYHLPHGTVGIPWLFEIPLPDCWFSTPWLSALGFQSPDFFSADYFPLFPWLFLFLAGSCLGIPLKENRFPACFYRQHSLLLSRIGRHTLWIYLLHQPVIFGLLLLIQKIFNL